MAFFVCENEIEIIGGTEAERGRAAGLILVLDCVDEDSSTSSESAGPAASLVLRFKSVDGLPEEELVALAPQFPELSFTLVYFSLDGEFFGYARSGAGGQAAESDDLDEAARELVGRRHDGDGLAFVRARYSLPRAGA